MCSFLHAVWHRQTQSNTEAAVTEVEQQLKPGSLHMVKEANTAMQKNNAHYTLEKSLKSNLCVVFLKGHFYKAVIL